MVNVPGLFVIEGPSLSTNKVSLRDYRLCFIFQWPLTAALSTHYQEVRCHGVMYE